MEKERKRREKYEKEEREEKRGMMKKGKRELKGWFCGKDFGNKFRTVKSPSNDDSKLLNEKTEVEDHFHSIPLGLGRLPRSMEQ